jgi:sugar lactone lactonase YvrE
MTALTLLLLAPRIGPLTQERSRVQEYVGIRSVLRGSPPERWPAILSNQFSVAFRAYLLFDPTLESGNPRYLEPGAPVLDSLTGTLYVVGLVFGVIHWRRTIFWWLLLLLFVFVIQGVSIYTPDGARAIPGLPAIALFAGLTIDRLLARERAFLFVLLGILVAVPSTMWWNWQHYAAWQQRPANAVARQPAVDPAEFPVWQAVQLERVRAGEPTYSVTEWKDVRGRYAVPAAVGGGPAPVASSVEVQPLVDFGPRTGLRQPRGVALAADGSAYVLDGDGRILQLNADGRQVAQLGQRTGGPSTGEPSDLAIGPDGSLYLLDAGRGVLDRYGPDGRFKETLGKEWAMYRPRGVGIGPDGLLYLADTGRDRVVVADGPRQLRAIPDLNQPTDIAVDAAGQLYVAQPDRGRVSVLDRDGRQSASWEIARGNTVEGPHLAFLEQGALAMTDPANKRLVFFDPAGHEIGSFAADGDLGFNAPYAVAALAERLLVVDSARPAIRAFDLSAR